MWQYLPQTNYLSTKLDTKVIRFESYNFTVGDFLEKLMENENFAKFVAVNTSLDFQL